MSLSDEGIVYVASEIKYKHIVDVNDMFKYMP